jgi:hypothetical protein
MFSSSYFALKYICHNSRVQAKAKAKKRISSPTHETILAFRKKHTQTKEIVPTGTTRAQTPTVSVQEPHHK